MAKKSTKKTPPSTEDIALAKRTALKVLDDLRALDEIWEADGVHTLPHKNADGQHKQRRLDTALQYILGDVYIGARGQFIFSFEPTDARDFVNVDVNEDQIDKVFPLIAGRFAEILKVESEDIKVLLATAIERQKRDEQRTEEEKIAARQAEVSAGYAEHPLFGRF